MLFGGRLNLSVIGAQRVDHPQAYRPINAGRMLCPAGGKPSHFLEHGEWDESAKIYTVIFQGNGKTICGSEPALHELMRERGAVAAELW